MVSVSRSIFTALFPAVLLCTSAGCEILPNYRLKPTMHNPLPQITEIAVVPFFNRTDSTKLDGRAVAKAYANECSKIPGFIVIPQKTVEETMIQCGLTGFEDFDNVDNIRKLGRVLGVEAVVLGDIHDFSAYYPPRMKLETKWYAVNPYFHYVPKGYALPWGTPDEEQIPDRIVFEAEHELARVQLQTQTPDDPNALDAKREQEAIRRPPEPPKRLKLTEKTIVSPNGIQRASVLMEAGPGDADALELSDTSELRKQINSDNMLMRSGISHLPNAPRKPLGMEEPEPDYPPTEPPLPSLFYGPDQTLWSDRNQGNRTLKSMTPQRPFPGQYPGYPPPPGSTPEELARYGQLYGVVPPLPAMYPMMPGISIPGQEGLVIGEPDRFPGLPAEWPDPRGFIPDGPKPEKPKAEISNNGPIMRHVAMFDGNDSEFTQALQDWDFTSRDDRRLMSWQSVLHNESEFIRFCCRMHIWQMLGARGGAGKAEIVRREYKLWFGGTKPYP